MFKLFIFLFSFCFLISCSNGNIKKIKQLKKGDTSNVSRSDISIQQNIQELIKTIESSECVFGKGIGITGEENRVYASFQRLTQLASDSLWLTLCYDKKSPVMRAYAFNALKTKNHRLLPDIKNLLEKDLSIICCHTNDIIFSCTVAFYVSNLK